MGRGNKTFRILSLILVSIIMVWCKKEGNIKTKDEIKIAVTVYRQDDIFISSILSNLEEIVKENESRYNCKIALQFMDVKGSVLN